MGYNRLIASALALVAYTPIAAVAGTLTETDRNQLDLIANSTFEKLRAGKTQEAVTEYFGSNSLVSNKLTELKMLADQIDSTTSAYGKMGPCELIEEDIRGRSAVTRLYLCSHEKYVTRWVFLIGRTTAGWSGANLKFDDKIANHLSD